MAERRATAAQIERAGRVLAREAMAEAKRIRDEQGHAGHVAAQELEHQAISVGGLASRLQMMRAGR
jgi:hypothetical protein